MPINKQSIGGKTSSRLTSSTISSSAKSKAETNDWNVCNEPIMKRSTNLTRTRSLRLPQRSRDQYSMSGHLIQNNTTEDNHMSSKGSTLSRQSSIRHSSESWSSQQSAQEVSLNANKNANNVTIRCNKSSNHSIGLKEALIPKFVRNSFGKFTKNNISDNSYGDKYRGRGSDEHRGDLMNGLRANTETRSPVAPSSPMSNSSRDSGIIGFNNNCNNFSQNYLQNHLRKLSEEHERLQMEYSRLRVQLIETTATLPNKLVQIDCQQSPETMELELKKERSLANNYKTEIIGLQEELKRLQRKYWENIINQKTINRCQTNGCEADSHSNSSTSQNASLEIEDIKHPDFDEKIRDFETKVKELENETKEAKESIEFLTSERSVLAESLKEAEENLLKERLIWIKEKEAFEEVKVWSKRIYDKLKEKSEKLKELETSLTERDKNIEKLIQSNKSNEKFAQNSCKLLNRIREKLLSLFEKNKAIDYPMIVSKLWPQIDSSNLNNFNDFRFDDSIIDENLINNCDSVEMEELKHKLNELTKENVLLKRDLNNRDSIINKKNEFLDHLKTENESNLKKVINLNKELDSLKEKYRCSESVNKELKIISEKSNDKCLSTEDMNSFRLENVSLKESLVIKEEMIEKLSAKYARNRKVWEENDKKATQEIKKLDDIVDHVIDTLKSMPDNYRNSEQIQEILELLNGEVVPQNK